MTIPQKSDGVIEAENDEHELFSNHRLVDYIKRGSGPPWGEGLLDVISEWRGTAEASDDLTMLEIWRDK